MTAALAYDDVDEALERCLATGAFGSRRDVTQPILDSTVSAALAIVDAAGVSDKIANWRAADATDRHPGGRPGALDDRAIMALFVLLALENSPLYIDKVAYAIEERLSERAKAFLHIRQFASDGDDWYDRCGRAIHRVLNVIDPYPAPRKKRISQAEFAVIETRRDPDTVKCREERLNEFADGLLKATWQMVPREIRRQWSGNICVDATPVKAFARGYSKRNSKTVEHDAAWYVREGDHRDTGDMKGRTHSKFIFGWEATIVIATSNDPSKPADFPLLATGMAFDKPGHNVAENAMVVMRSMREHGMPVGFAVGDRAYWPNAMEENLQLPMRALGYSNVNDYRDDQFGVKAGHAGGIMVEGAWYCPSMPTPLIEATIDYRVKKTIDEVMWKKRIAARTPFMLHAKESPDADGHQPLRCPAIGASATVACPLRPDSARGQRVALRSRVSAPPKHADRICRQTSVSFPPSVGAKYRQDIQYGTDEWHEAYSTARNTIEGFNGFIKDGAHEALADSTRRRLRGRAAQHVLTALLVMAANVRKIRAFVADLVATPAQIERKAQRRQRRKRESLADYLPVLARPPDGEETLAS